MTETKVTSIRIDAKLLKKAQGIGLNVSKTCENALRSAIKRLESNNGETGSNLERPDTPSNGHVLGRELNPRPSPYQGNFLGKSCIKKDCGEFNDVVEDFRKVLTVDLRLGERTVRDHCYRLKRILREIDKNPMEINRENVRDYLLMRQKTRSARTVNDDLKTLKRFFRDYLMRPEVVSTFKFATVDAEPIQLPSKEQIQRFYNALPSINHKATFLLFATSGWRKGEILCLTRKDIDLGSRRLQPRKQSSRTKKAGVGFFNLEAQMVLKEYLSKHRFKENEKVFSSYRALRRAWNKAEEETGVHVMPQILREWFCSEMGRLGVQDRYVDAFCGRVPKSVLAKHYTDYSSERLKKIYDNANLKVLS